MRISSSAFELQVPLDRSELANTSKPARLKMTRRHAHNDSV